MPTPTFRARWLAPVLLAAALSGCAPPEVEGRMAATQAQIDPPQLWRVQSLDANGAVTAELLVCADRTLREGFARAHAEAAGQACKQYGPVVEKDGVFAMRCELNGDRYGLTVTRTGDPARDFTAAFAFTNLERPGISVKQSRRYRLEGACPNGWGIGDQARPNARPGVNSLAATWGG
jgi:hypothetical protein